MGAQHHPRPIREAWVGALRADGGLSLAVPANRQIITATNRVHVGSRKRVEPERRRFFFNLPRWPTAITPCTIRFSLCRRYRSGSALLLLTVAISSAHRLRLTLATIATALSVCHANRQTGETERRNCQRQRNKEKKRWRERERERERENYKEQSTTIEEHKQNQTGKEGR